MSTTVLATDIADAEDEAGRATSSRARGRPACPGPWPPTLWAIAPGSATRRHGEQLLDVELQADAEHQQDDADLGELLREWRSATKPGVYGPTRRPAMR